MHINRARAPSNKNISIYHWKKYSGFYSRTWRIDLYLYFWANWSKWMEFSTILWRNLIINLKMLLLIQFLNRKNSEEILIKQLQKQRSWWKIQQPLIFQNKKYYSYSKKVIQGCFRSHSSICLITWVSNETT